MSRKSTGTAGANNPPPPSGVDFLFRTMIERESTGKRQIRPKNVEDLFVAAMGDESDDPDYEEAESSGSHSDISGNTSSDDSKDSGSSESKDSDDSSDSSDGSEENNSSDSDDDDDTAKGKKSALRETIQKLKETSNFSTSRPKKKKRKVKASGLNATSGKKEDSALQSSIGIEKSDNETTKTPKSSKKRPASSAQFNSKSKIAKVEPKKTNTSKSKGLKSKSKKKIAEKSKKNKRKKEKKSKGHKSKYSSISSLVIAVSVNQKENRKEIDESRAPICSACLGDKSDESNEIVECDFCGITVHEGCYGIGDSLSISSGSGSSCSTEPWFCDACKNGASKITCDLCPTTGGLFKETSNGRWVHLVCALYTPGVGVGDAENPPNLNDLRYKWGSHTCSLCESERYATTGVPIQCDAGLCKTYLHVTCAQKVGLLSDYTQADSMGPEADPYFAACKLHTNRDIARRRGDSFKTLQEQLRIKKEKKESDQLPDFKKLSLSRIMEKLNKIRCKISAKQNKLAPTAIEGLDCIKSTMTSSGKDIQRKSRFLQTSSSASDSFLCKAGLMGEDIKALELEDRNERIVTNVKRKWNVQPALGVEFAAYYTDREVRITTLSQQCEELEHNNMKLNDKQIALKNAWETHCFNNQAIIEDSEEIKTKVEDLKNILQHLGSPNKRFISAVGLLTRVATENEQSWGSRRSPTRVNAPNVGRTAKRKVIKLLSPPHSGRLSILKCDVCHKSDGQHMMTNCDECKKTYHLGCLDPPLTRMPKRTRLQGWVCSDCNEVDEIAEDEAKEPQVDTDAPRSLRGRTNIKKPGKYRNSDESGDEDIKIISEKISAADKKPVLPIPIMQMSPEVRIIKELNPVYVNGNVRSSTRRRSGTGNVAVNSSAGSSKSSPGINSPKGTSSLSPSRAFGSNNTSSSSLKKVPSPSPLDDVSKASKQKNTKKIKHEVENSKEESVIAKQEKSVNYRAPKVKDKRTLAALKKECSTPESLNSKKSSVEVLVNAIAFENAYANATPLGPNQTNSKSKPLTTAKKRKSNPVSTVEQTVLTTDQKSVPLKKRRRLPSAHTRLSVENATVANSNGSCEFRTNLSSNKNKASVNDCTIDLKLMHPTQVKIENHLGLKSHSVSVNCNSYVNYAPGPLSVNTGYNPQPNSSSIDPSYVPVVDVNKNAKFTSRDIIERDAVSLLTTTTSTTWSPQSQNQIQLHYNVDVPDPSRSYSPAGALNSIISPSASVESKCDTCGKPDVRKNLVMCDKCRSDFHFMCLDPPLKYSPKRRGYSWFCANCEDEASSSDSKNENGVD